MKKIFKLSLLFISFSVRAQVSLKNVAYIGSFGKEFVFLDVKNKKVDFFPENFTYKE